jgi:hypothetical protein
VGSKRDCQGKPFSGKDSFMAFLGEKTRWQSRRKIADKAFLTSDPI